MMTMKINSLILLFFFVPVALIAQQFDNKLRLSGGLETEIFNDVDFKLKYEYRLDRNMYSFDKTFLEPEVEIEIFNDVKLGAKYRFSYNKKKNPGAFEQRFAVFGNYEYSYDDFEFTVQGTLQYGAGDLAFNNTNTDNSELVGRYSVKVDYDWFGTKMEPYVKYELFHHLNHKGGALLNAWKLKTGLQYDISSNSSFDIFYMFENEFNVSSPVDANVLGLGYECSF
jgi:hypothetical protein